MKRLFITFGLLLFLCYSPLRAQKNIVLNPSFEEILGNTKSWFEKRKLLKEVVFFWSSASKATPDIYGPQIVIPPEWSRRGFGKVSPHSGNFMAGITVFGCDSDKPHCKEYLQGKFSEPLEADQRYEISFCLCPLNTGHQIGQLQLLFVNKKQDFWTDREIPLAYQLELDLPSYPKHKTPTWVCVRDTFVAKASKSSFILGNFKTDKETKHAKFNTTSQAFGYYYIDDISIRKIPEIKPSSFEDWIPFRVDKRIEIKGLFFDSDKDIPQQTSIPDLAKLFDLLTLYPDMEIVIEGHTDSIGTDAYNLDLAHRRANFVVKYLKENGIDAKRISAHSFGEKKPRNTNDTIEGRQHNRRVEFRIIKM